MPRYLPRRGYTTKPRVASASERTLGGRDTTPGFNPNRTRHEERCSDVPGDPGCASRPWALLCNPFGVNTSTITSVVMFETTG